MSEERVSSTPPPSDLPQGEKPLYPPLSSELSPRHDGLESGTQRLQGFVIEHSIERPGQNSKWFSIYSPLLQKCFFSDNKKLFELFRNFQPTPVSFSTSSITVSFLGRPRQMATDITPLTGELLRRANNTLPQQSWLSGTLAEVNVVRNHICVEITRPDLPPYRFHSSSSFLHPHTHLLPVGCPVRFQVRFTPPTVKGTRGSTTLSAIMYDHDRAHWHLGVLPSPKHLDEVFVHNDDFVPLLLGGSSLLDPRGVSLSEILIYNQDLRRADIRGLIDCAARVLESRLRDLPPEDKDAEALIYQSLQVLEGTDKFNVVIYPTFFSRDTWLQMGARFFSRFDPDLDKPIERFLLLTQVPQDTTPSNVELVTSLCRREVEHWKAPDALSSLQLCAGFGPFVSLDDYIVDDGLDLFQDVHHLKREVLGTSGDQLLIIELRENNGPPRELVASRVFDRQMVVSEDDFDKDSREGEAFLVSFPHKDQGSARFTLDSMLGTSHFVETADPHPDRRFQRIHVMLSRNTAHDIQRIIYLINNTTLNYALTAARSSLVKDPDDAFIRTLICRTGYNPPLGLLRTLDKDLQVYVISHGVLRIFSERDTPWLIRRLRGFNDADRANRKVARNDSQAPFQIIKDGVGSHWICSPAAPPSNNFKGWGQQVKSTLSSTVAQILVTGIDISLSYAEIQRIFTTLEIPSTAWSSTRWISVAGAAGTRRNHLLLSHPSLDGLPGFDGKAGKSILFANYIIIHAKRPLDFCQPHVKGQLILQDSLRPPASVDQVLVALQTAQKQAGPNPLGHFLGQDDQKLVDTYHAHFDPDKGTPAQSPTPPAQTPSPQKKPNTADIIEPASGSGRQASPKAAKPLVPLFNKDDANSGAFTTVTNRRRKGGQGNKPSPSKQTTNRTTQSTPKQPSKLTTSLISAHDNSNPKNPSKSAPTNVFDALPTDVDVSAPGPDRAPSDDDGPQAGSHVMFKHNGGLMMGTVLGGVFSSSGGARAFKVHMRRPYKALHNILLPPAPPPAFKLSWKDADGMCLVKTKPSTKEMRSHTAEVVIVSCSDLVGKDFNINSDGIPNKVILKDVNFIFHFLRACDTQTSRPQRAAIFGSNTGATRIRTNTASRKTRGSRNSTPKNTPNSTPKSTPKKSPRSTPKSTPRNSSTSPKPATSTLRDLFETEPADLGNEIAAKVAEFVFIADEATRDLHDDMKNAVHDDDCDTLENGSGIPTDPFAHSPPAIPTANISNPIDTNSPTLPLSDSALTPPPSSSPSSSPPSSSSSSSATDSERSPSCSSKTSLPSRSDSEASLLAAEASLKSWK